jgi:hypothetical protein
MDKKILRKALECILLFGVSAKSKMKNLLSDLCASAVNKKDQ